MSIVVQQDWLPVLCYSGSVAAGATLQCNQVNLIGYNRLVGNFYSSAAPAATYPAILQSADGVTFDLSNSVDQDATQSNYNFPVNFAISLPYVSVQIQDAGAGSTVRCAIYAVPSGEGSSSGSPGPAPTPSETKTYNACFNGLSAPAGQFFELVGTSGTVARIREIYLFKPSANVEIIGRQQSVASTGGTSTTTVAKMDLNNAANQCTAKQYTVAPTAGTTAGNIFDIKLVTAGDTVGFSYGDVWDEPIVVRTGGSFAMSLDAAATIYGYVRWTESSS